MIVTNNLNLSESLVDAVTPKIPHNAEGCISATTLIRGTKDIILSKRHWNEMTEDASNLIYSAFGTAVHKVFEEAEDKPGVIKEQKFSKKVGKYTITGTLDRFDPSTETLYDYKTTSVYKVKGGNYEEWYSQLMIYAWLLRDNGYKVSRLCIYALLRDWSRTDSRRDPKYPQSQVVRIPFDITDDDFTRIEDFINSKVSEIEKAESLEDDAIPPCSEKERWQRPDKFAVMVEGGKRAVKRFDTKEEADTFMLATSQDPKNSKKKYFIEVRPGASVKCLDYCSCCSLCNFYKEHVAQSEAEEA